MLKINKLIIKRNDVALINNLSIDIKPGDIVNLIGPNGAGKSTLLKTIAGLLPAFAGDIVANADFLYLGHKNAVKDNLTVSENIELFKNYLNTTIIDNNTVLTTLMLANKHNHYANTLSEGQKRKLALSKLFFSKQKIWLLDEPFSSLDKETTAILLAKFIEHSVNGGAVIFSAHKNYEIKTTKTINLTDYR